MAEIDETYPETTVEGLFETDHFDLLDQLFFGSLRRSGHVYADPSGWIDTMSQAASQLPPVKAPLTWDRYYLDVGSTLGSRKGAVSALLSAWEGRSVPREEITICPSVSAASLAVLAALKGKGVSRLLLETPCYFATLEQAHHLGLKVQPLPSYLHERFQLDDLPATLAEVDDAVVWITQPRAALGMDQRIDFAFRLLDAMNERTFLVVDEATDQTFPAILGMLRAHPNAERLIKLKNFTKPMGLNGVRLAAILHPAELRPALSSFLETFGGSVDIHSLETIVSFASDVETFRQMLATANRQVTDLRQKIEKMAWGTEIQIMPLANGYIGSLALPVSSSAEGFAAGRRRLLEFCQMRAMPVILGPSMYFACDRPTEFIRLNYLSHPQHLFRAVELLAKFQQD